MDVVRNSAQRVGRVLPILGLLLASIIPAVMPALAAAATVTERSVALSSSVKSATATAYNVSFKGVATSTGVFEIDFCDTAVIGGACTPPAGLSTTGVGTTGGDTVTATNTNTGVKVVLATPVAGGVAITVPLTGITNPSTAGVMYARIVTYVDGTAYTANYVDQDTLGTHLDDGSVALTITDGFSVNGSVLESLIFCASGSASAIGTGCSTNVTSPNLTLGAGGVLTTVASSGTIKTQVSTNANGGVVVSLKNSSAGGGLKRAEASTSDIGPLTSAAASIADNASKFGLKLGNLTGGSAVSGSYSTANFFIDYAVDNLTGVTSPYGSPIYNTAGAPINDGTADLTFAANISNLTPAGTYSAALNLIATGKF
ncbi:MAG: hypothetical protein WAW80_05170 [Candidatus Saccharimonadales bacterium]